MKTALQGGLTMTTTTNTYKAALDDACAAFSAAMEKGGTKGKTWSEVGLKKDRMDGLKSKSSTLWTARK
jgi:hypothetical protein